jgi:hypothetical protein
MSYRRRSGLSSLATWHSQTGLLLVSMTWGLSYMMPAQYRISFSEVFPPNITDSILSRMWIWGLLMVLPSATGLIAEQIMTHSRRMLYSKWLWGWVIAAHVGLSAIYFGLACGALFAGFNQIPGADYPHPAFWAGVISAISRPVLWGVLGYLHTTFARLPIPEPIEVQDDPEEEDRAL